MRFETPSPTTPISSGDPSHRNAALIYLRHGLPVKVSSSDGQFPVCIRTVLAAVGSVEDGIEFCG